MTDRVRAAALFRERIGGERLIEGWVEGPVAEAADLRGLQSLMVDFTQDPAFVRDLLDFALELGLCFARAQVEAGCDLVGIGDAAASLIGPRLYEEFVWPREKRLIEGIHALGASVRLHICGNIRPLLRLIGQLGADIVDLDFMVPVREAREAMGPRQALLGNLHPVALMRDGTPEGIRDAIAACRNDAGTAYIAGAGCEIPRGTPLENLRALRPR